MVPHDSRGNPYRWNLDRYNIYSCFRSWIRLGALMLFCSLIGAVTFYSGWEIGRGRPEEQEPEDQETSDAEHRQEL